MPYTYPPAQPSISGDVVTINRFLNDPTQVARRLRTLAEQRYIADVLLKGRLTTESGSVVYETAEGIFADRDPRAVSPGGEYSLTTLTGGTPSLAKTVKWGQDAEIFDEAISRQRMAVVDRAFTKLVNQNVKYVDSVALAAIATAVTATAAAAADWTSAATAAQILKDVLTAKANILALNQGYDPDTVVVDDINHAAAMAAFVAAGYFSREDNGQNPALTGQFPVIAGMRWLATPNVPTANVAIVLDSNALGAMADERLGGPGYSMGNGQSVEVKSMRIDDRDGWRIRARRVTVPIVLEPAAARKITGI
jgi:hypothetical protein